MSNVCDWSAWKLPRGKEKTVNVRSGIKLHVEQIAPGFVQQTQVLDPSFVVMEKLGNRTVQRE
jgi:hypothetical protein